jgi:hypothetical protein
MPSVYLAEELVTSTPRHWSHLLGISRCFLDVRSVPTVFNLKTCRNQSRTCELRCRTSVSLQGFPSTPHCDCKAVLSTVITGGYVQGH